MDGEGPVGQSPAESATPTIERLQGWIRGHIDLEKLKCHLEQAYGSPISTISQLDTSVYHVTFTSSGPGLVVRIFPRERSLLDAENEAALLRYVRSSGIPAEECAQERAVTEREGHILLATIFVEGEKARPGPQTLRRLGNFLGKLHSLPVPDTFTERKAGAWHHLSLIGDTAEEIAVLKFLLAEYETTVALDEQPLFETLRQEVNAAKSLDDLPKCLVHPDFVPSNAIANAPGSLVVVDWTGAGYGCRVASLGPLLFAAGGRDLIKIDGVVEGYRSQVTLEKRELDALEHVVHFFKLKILCWEVCLGRKDLRSAVEALPPLRQKAVAIAGRARAAFSLAGV